MRTLIDALRDNAAIADKGITFVRSDGSERTFSYRDVWGEACRRAAVLGGLGVEKGDRVVLTVPEPDDFVLTFFGALTAGAVPVPLYPPQTLARLDAYVANLSRVVEVARAKLLVTGNRPLWADDDPTDEARALRATPIVRADQMAEKRGDGSAGEAGIAIGCDDLAFLQFTSGSTSNPKGVMVTHGNLAANSYAIMFDGLRSDPARDRGVSWLPLYHDMGLIGFVVAPIFAQVPVVLLPTTSFVRRPSTWLDAVNRYRGTITFAPNFAYALATQGISARQMEGWDLSCVRALGCGAEPVDAETVRAFMDKFAPVGLARTAILPSYGLAEATLAVTFSSLEEPLVTDAVEPSSLRSGKATRAANGHSVELVSCGRSFPSHTVQVLGEAGNALGEREIGEIVVQGPSVAKGYFGDDVATAATFKEGRLFTGDLGYFADGRLYVCGRSKDLIILRGRNYYPQDIEKIISDIEGVRTSQVAVFTCARQSNGNGNANHDAASGDLRLVAVAEVSKSQLAQETMRRAIVAAVQERMGIKVDEVHFLRRGALPKTSSGKVRRRETRARLFEGTLQLATGSEE
jgi:fatty-acyl-CoA synthase